MPPFEGAGGASHHEASSGSPKADGDAAAHVNTAGTFTPVLISFRDLRYTVLSRSLAGAETGRKELLRGISADIAPGRLIAIMGSSGAGKTTLLNALADRLALNHNAILTGEVTFNGAPMDAALKKQFGYVTQNDIVYETATPRECTTFSAMLRLQGLSNVQKGERAETVLKRLRLTKCADTVIGTEGLRRGISGGERKRTNIAIELVTSPSLLFLDEPTSGLDSFTSLEVLKCLKELAAEGRGVVCTIHQPSSELFGLFDDLLFLSEGRVAYAGPADAALEYFRALGHPCPDDYNPADHFIRVLHEDRSLPDAWDKYPGKPPLVPQVPHGGAPKAPATFSDSYAAGYWTQLSLLTRRSWLNYTREPLATRARLGQTVVFALLIGLFFFGVNRSQTSIQDRQGALFIICMNNLFGSLLQAVSMFQRERPIVIRERASSMYVTSAYFSAKMVAEFPFQLFFPMLQACIVYFMVKFDLSVVKFFVFAAIITLLGNAAQSLGLCIAAGISSLEIAYAVTPLIMMPFVLSGGLFANNSRLDPYWLWLKYLSPIQYCYSVLVENEFVGLQFDCPPAPQPCRFVDGAAVLSYLQVGQAAGYTPMWVSSLVLVAYMIAFRYVAYLILVLNTRKSRIIS